MCTLNGNNLNIQKQKGVTLIELMLGLVIISVIIGIGIIAYQKVQANARTYRTTSGILALTAGIKGIYTTPVYTNITPSVLICSGKAPSDLINGAGACATQTLVGLWGGTVLLAAANFNAGTGNAYTITYPNVPANECNSILASIAPNFPKITAGTGTGTVLKDDSAATPIVFDPATTSTACANTANTIALTST
jgi:prepilin-type N-terminal cleavage/methylation domain-containing protein